MALSLSIQPIFGPPPLLDRRLERLTAERFVL